MEPQIELHLLSNRLKVMSVRKSSIHKLAFPIFKIAFTDKTASSYFSFNETNDDFTIITDNAGMKELSSYIDDNTMFITDSYWIPMILCGDDLPGAMSISKIAKYIILPLADWKISILAISMYQCDYILIQEKDYDSVISCLSNHIPKIFDESLSAENEIVFMRKEGEKIFSDKSLPLSSPISSHSLLSLKDLRQQNKIKQRSITLPLVIPDESEYCITGLYSQEAFILIIPTLIEIMFYETENYRTEEIFFNFIKKDSDISLVMETRLLKKFPLGTLLNIQNDYWKLIRIGKKSVGLEIFGVCASISYPLEKANIDEYYISSYHTGYCFIPSDKLNLAKDMFAKQQAIFEVSSRAPLSDDNEEISLDDELDNPSNGLYGSDLDFHDAHDDQKYSDNTLLLNEGNILSTNNHKTVK